MSTLEQKLEEIELNVMKLAEQNVQYKQICNDLLKVRRTLEEENSVLKKELEQIQEENSLLKEKTAQISDLQTGQRELNIFNSFSCFFFHTIKNKVRRFYANILAFKIS